MSEETPPKGAEVKPDPDPDEVLRKLLTTPPNPKAKKKAGSKPT
jgi:hypothetical protein